MEKYLYCITNAEAPRVEMPGLGGKPLDYICFRNIACVTSEATYQGPPPFPMDRESLVAHERVCEAALEKGAVLPIRFGTVAPSKEGLTEQVLGSRYEEFATLLRDMHEKAEFGIRAAWRDMPAIYREITEENPRIRGLRDALRKQASYQGQVRLGEMVQAALREKRRQEAERITAPLRSIAQAWKDLEPLGDPMVCSAALLVQRHAEEALDERVNQLSEQYRSRLQFRYFGPTPPHNFVQLFISFTPQKHVSR